MAEKNRIDGKEVFKVTIALFLICAITTALLALVSNVTAEPIENNRKAATAAAMQSVVPNASSFEEEEAFSGSCYRALDGNSQVIGYAISTSASGYGGKINVMTGIDSSGKITAVAVISADDETPGLGLKVKEENFRLQFEGKDVPLVLVTAGQGTGAENEIDAITSATYSSRAVVNAVNEALEIYSSVSGGES